ncbi:MAG: hypothetical protein ACYC4N_26845 [Pirellulaceae bacterium]
MPVKTVMDVGGGMGFCSVAMAKIVGDSGLVIAVDLQPATKSARNAAVRQCLLQTAYTTVADLRVGEIQLFEL